MNLKIQEIVRNVIIIVIICVIIILLPCLLDFFVFGNDVKSNITNSEWVSFLGGYSGGVATLLALIGTILYNNYCNREAENNNYIRDRENRRTQIQPLLDKRIDIAKGKSDIFGSNDRSFIIEDDKVSQVRFYLRNEDRERMQLDTEKYYYLKYSVVNVGAGNAVRMKISLNGYEESYTILKEETVNLYLLFNMSNRSSKQMKIVFDYWDVASIGHYQQMNTLLIEYREVDGDVDWTIKPEPISPPQQLNGIESKNGFKFSTKQH